jgi:hypothetical protein
MLIIEVNTQVVKSVWQRKFSDSGTLGNINAISDIEMGFNIRKKKMETMFSIVHLI